ncbi:ENDORIBONUCLEASE YBEY CHLOROPLASTIC [Salix koriyanagi]|uniref:ENDORIBONUCLEASE YBEY CHLOROPLASTIC n=1 Tax=Salix koriyanagi TaxID=2511006 RepID=A0A9Q0VDN3_9ROSI|nr:ENDORIBONUCLEASE YBEY CHLOROPLASTIC [Salix koriyanagi]
MEVTTRAWHLPILKLGDVVISAETAARKAVFDSINQNSDISSAIWMGEGLSVYGRQGREILRSNLDLSVCREAYLYSWLNEVPLIAFSNDHFLTLFEHPLVDSLHTAEIMPSVEHLLSPADMQRLLREWLAPSGHTDQKQLEAVPMSSKLSQTRSKLSSLEPQKGVV